MREIARLRATLIDRAARVGVTLLENDALDQLSAYYSLLSHWNKKINLVGHDMESMSDPVVDRVIIEPLLAAQHVLDAEIDWIDLGSGGGSPAYPMKIVRPLVRLTLIEARSRKAAFLRHVALELNLSNVSVITERLETIADRPHLISPADLLTVRALRTDARFFEQARKLSRSNGQLFVFGATDAALATHQLFRRSQAVELAQANSELVILSAV